MAVALCLGGALTACGGGDGEGYAAVGAGPSPKGAVAPSGVVTLVPLESPSASGTTSSTSSPSPAAPGTPGAPGASSTGPDGASPGPSGSPGTSGTPGPSRTDTSTGSAPGTGSGTAPTTAPGRGGSGAATPPRTPSATPRPPVPGTGTPSPAPTTTPPGPAVLTVSAPGLADGDRRWCQRVTVTFRNTGGSAATSGTAGFSTHIIGLLGTDWGTVDSRQPLPAPIAAGTARTQTYTVCVDSWQVPLGMRIDTRTVTAEWR